MRDLFRALRGAARPPPTEASAKRAGTPSRAAAIPRAPVSVYARLAAALAAGVLAGALWPGARLDGRLVIGSATGATLFLLALAQFMWPADEERMRRNAASHDVAPWTLLSIVLAASVLGVVAIVRHLAAAQGLEGWDKAIHVALALWTTATGWACVHGAFAVHYAHEYYRLGEDGAEQGVRFPGDAAPDYWDFVYFAFTIGCAAQTADVEIASPILRRVAAAHQVIAFFYNLAILGLFVNVAAGLMSGK